ncbi:MAG: adenylate kinase [Proteobacteria bacterium]|nr:adenylate kinase [Pseudomonadota bacterium]
MNLILLGPPGSGKGTQARLIRDQHGLVLIATGDILREEVQKETPLGLEVKGIMDAGLYPSDDIILEIFEKHLRQAKNQGVILDGVPRTLNQAEKVDKMFEKLGTELTMVIQLAVDEKELINRLSNRQVCKSCGASYTIDLPPRVVGMCDACSGSDFVRRADDAPEAVKTRLDVYNERTKPLIDYYARHNRLRSVDGMKSVDQVNEQIEILLRDFQ